MNPSQIHLALTHVPVILSLTGLVILVIAMFIKSRQLVKTALYIFIVAGIIAVPVFLSGEGAEEAVEKLPGVTESIIEQHEDLAAIGFYILLATAILSIAGLFVNKTGRYIIPLVLLVAFVSAGVMAYTAHLGGQIRHTELRQGVATVQDAGMDNNHEESDDD